MIETDDDGTSAAIENAVLGPGDMFGEVCLVRSVPRLVTVRSTTYTDIFTLSKSSLDEAMSDFPNSKNEIMRSADRFESMGEMSSSEHVSQRQRRPSVYVSQTETEI